MASSSQGQVRFNQRHMKALRSYFGWILTGCSVTFFAWKIHWQTVYAALAHVNDIFILFGLVLVLICYLVFTARWRHILGYNHPYWSLFKLLMIGHMANSLLPLRAGDLIRTFLTSKHRGLNVATVFGSLLLERMGDIFALCVIAFIVVCAIQSPDVITRSLQFIAVVSLIVLGGVIWIAVNRGSFERILNRALGTSNRYSPRLVMHFEHFEDAFSSLGMDTSSLFRRLFAIALISLIAWGIYSLGMIACVAAFGVLNPVLPALLLVVVTNLGSAIPSSPGSIGVFHALAIVALSPWHIPLETAMAIGIVAHLITVFVQVILGLTGQHQLKRS